MECYDNDYVASLEVNNNITYDIPTEYVYHFDPILERIGVDF